MELLRAVCPSDDVHYFVAARSILKDTRATDSLFTSCAAVLLEAWPGFSVPEIVNNTNSNSLRIGALASYAPISHVVMLSLLYYRGLPEISHPSFLLFGDCAFG